MSDESIHQRLDELIATNRAELAALEQQATQSRALIGENRQAFEDVSFALRQMLLRADRMALEHSQVLQDLRAEMREHRQEFREHRGEFREHRGEFREHRGEFRDEMRAQREALFAMIDQLRGGGGPAAAGA